MSTPQSPTARRTSDQLSPADAWRHVSIWMLLATATVLLVGFTALVDDSPQQGELRHAHKTAAGYLELSEELPRVGFDVMRLLEVRGDTVVER